MLTTESVKTKGKNHTFLVKQVLKNEVTHNPLILTKYRPKPLNRSCFCVPQEAIYAPGSGNFTAKATK